MHTYICMNDIIPYHSFSSEKTLTLWCFSSFCLTTWSRAWCPPSTPPHPHPTPTPAYTTATQMQRNNQQVDKLACNNVEQIWLIQFINYMLLSIISSKISVCFSKKKQCSGCTLAILQPCVITCELTVRVQISFNFAADNVMQSTGIHWVVMQILVPPVYIITASQVFNHGYKPCWYGTSSGQLVVFASNNN